MGKKRSKIFTEKTEVLQKYLDESSSMSEVCRKLGLSGHGRSSTILNKRVRESSEFDLTKFEKNKKEVIFKTQGGKRRDNLDDIMVENSTYNTTHLKNNILRLGLMENECSECGQKGEWRGKPLRMVLDHINGVNNDHRLKNLRMLCPNCNSQQPTFCIGINNKQ